jgi:predicted transcriptional regulator
MLEIQIEILRFINHGVEKPTRIMYSCNINWIPLTKILNSLSEQGAVLKKSNSSRDEYYITDKGRTILEYYDRSTSMLIGKVRVRPV